MKHSEKKLNALSKIHLKLITYPGSVLHELLHGRAPKDGDLNLANLQEITVSHTNKTMFREFSDKRMYAKIRVVIASENEINVINDEELIRFEEDKLTDIAENLRTYDEFREFVKQQEDFVDNVLVPGTVLLYRSMEFYVIRKPVEKYSLDPMEWMVTYDHYSHSATEPGYAVMALNNKYSRNCACTYSEIYGLSPCPISEFKSTILNDLDKAVQAVEIESQERKAEIEKARRTFIREMTETENK